MHRSLVLSALGFLVWTTAPRAHAQLFDANASFLANELDPLTETTPTFGPFSVGYGLNAGDFTLFLPSQHENTFAGNPNTQGFHVANNVIVPAAVINVDAVPGSGFSGLNPGEILLHPGGLGPDGSVAPIYAGLVRFTVPSDGYYTITGNFRSLDGGITQNNILFTNASNTTTRIASLLDAGSFNLTLQLAANDRIDFSVGVSAGTGIGGDSTGLTASLSRSISGPPPSGTTKINIDFNGKRPGDADSAGTYFGPGAAGGGNTFNGLTADSTGGDDNLQVSGSNLLNDQGIATKVAFTIGLVGGDHEPGQANQPDVLFDDYVFNNSAANSSPTGSPFTISGLSDAATADLYFYMGFNTGIIGINGVEGGGVAGNYNGLNAIFFDDVPVTNGTVEGVLSANGSTGVLSGLTVEFIPEPCSTALMAFGGIAALLRRRRVAL
ncbi:MAG: hypothetical protein JWL90_3241 [Chthoniobacteraceae bacterium]|nr:hypothetical protein [Chthoniobacteraceae bacterium]